MSAMASQITGVLMVCLIVCSGANQRKHQSSVIWRPHIGCTRRVVGHSIRFFQPAWTFHMCHVWKTDLQSADALHYHTICELCDKGSNILMAPSHILDMANLPPCWKSFKQHIRRWTTQPPSEKEHLSLILMFLPPAMARYGRLTFKVQTRSITIRFVSCVTRGATYWWPRHIFLIWQIFHPVGKASNNT